jgi:hypothetical protein
MALASLRRDDPGDYPTSPLFATEPYFWREGGTEEQPRTKRSYTRRNKRQEETAEQYFSQAGKLEHETPVEESPELGQTPL